MRDWFVSRHTPLVFAPGFMSYIVLPQPMNLMAERRRYLLKDMCLHWPTEPEE